MFSELESPSCIILYTVNGFSSLNAAAPHNLHTGCQLQNVIISVRVYILYTIAAEMYILLTYYTNYVYERRSQIGIILCVCI